MKEAHIDLWDAPADLRLITTNGTVLPDKRNIMGGGCAREAADKFPTFSKDVGYTIFLAGHHVRVIATDHYMWKGAHIGIFPVKHSIDENADIALIERSAIELMGLVDTNDYHNVLLPRPGCGLGGLNWKDVRPVIEPILDDRITVVTFADLSKSDVKRVQTLLEAP